MASEIPSGEEASIDRPESERLDDTQNEEDVCLLNLEEGHTAQGHSAADNVKVLAQNLRFEHLDGLRGLSAFLVATFHFCMIYFAFHKNDNASASSDRANEWKVFLSPLSFLYGGSFCVRIFFVLSGYVLSNPIISFKSNDNDFARLMIEKCVSRLPRLALPTMASIAFALLCQYSRFVPKEVYEYTKTPYVGPIEAVISSWSIWSVDSLYNYPAYVVMDKVDPLLRGISINGVLWTMPIELRASFGIFALAAIQKAIANVYPAKPLLNKATFAIYGMLLALLLYTHAVYISFAYGVILAHIDHHLSYRISRAPWYRFISDILGFYIMWWVALLLFAGLLSPYEKAILPVTEHGYAVFAAVAVGACNHSGPLRVVFSSWFFSKFLGQGSFSLYLVHLPLAIGSIWHTQEHPERGLPLFVALCLSVTPVFWWAIERHARPLSKKVAKALMS
eukprot:Nk52_evm32s370 gene=Nk52_evmTU32s370